MEKTAGCVTSISAFRPPLLTLCGFNLELFVDEVLERGAWPTLCTATDFTGARWLIVQTCGDPSYLEWMCAPASERALSAVRNRDCSPEDVLCHSATGTIEVISVDRGRAVPDRTIECKDVRSYLHHADAVAA